MHTTVLARLGKEFHIMPWLWGSPIENNTWGADFDYTASKPSVGIESLSTVPIPLGSVNPIFKSRVSLKRFKTLHCPPASSFILVDSVWEKIILEFVPRDRVQFYPVRLIARGEICDDFKWVIPFDRVRCIDLEKSRYRNRIDKPGISYVFSLDSMVLKPGCMGPLHLARDEQDTTALYVSNELRNALATTGEDSMFYRPEEYPTRHPTARGS